MHANRRPVLLLALCLVLSACQVRLGTDLVLDAEGGGTLELVVALDDELTELLDDAGVDLRRGLPETRSAAPDWEVEERPVEEGTELRFRSAFADPDELQQLVEDLHAGLDAGDGRLLRSLEVRVTPRGEVLLDGMAGLILPETTGAEGTGVEVDGEDLRELLATRGDEFVRYDLRVTLPADAVEHDADVVEGRTLRWELPVGEMRSVSARSEVPTDRTWLLAAAVATGGFVLALLTVTTVRARQRRRLRRAAGRRLTPSG